MGRYGISARDVELNAASASALLLYDLPNHDCDNKLRSMTSFAEYGLRDKSQNAGFNQALLKQYD